MVWYQPRAAGSVLLFPINVGNTLQVGSAPPKWEESWPLHIHFMCICYGIDNAQEPGAMNAPED